MTSNWYVLRIKSRAEASVAGELARHGYDCFLPQVKTLRPNRDMVYAPLYPGYLFLRVDIESADAELARHRAGVLGWLRIGDIIPSMPEEIVANIKQQVMQINRAGGVWKRFRPGDKVRVVSGNLESMAEVTEAPYSAHGLVRVMLYLMGRNVDARVPWHTLQSVTDQPDDGKASRGFRRTRGHGRWVQGRRLIGAAQG